MASALEQDWHPIGPAHRLVCPVCDDWAIEEGPTMARIVITDDGLRYEVRQPSGEAAAIAHILAEHPEDELADVVRRELRRMEREA
jgi:hypothetical protein